MTNKPTIAEAQLLRFAFCLARDVLQQPREVERSEVERRSQCALALMSKEYAIAILDRCVMAVNNVLDGRAFERFCAQAAHAVSQSAADPEPAA